MTERNDKIGGTIRFTELVKKVQQNLTNLSNTVVDMIDSGQQALLEDDETLFGELEKELVRVHEVRGDLEMNIITSVVLHQPFARDLRFLVSSLKVSNEIHRSGHDAVHIAHTSKFFDRSMTCYTAIVEKVGKLASMALSMFKDSIKAFQERKALDIKEWKELDDEVDDFHNQIIDEITEQMMSNCENVRVGVSLILATRYIERIADHACNIVEEAAFVVTSERPVIE